MKHGIVKSIKTSPLLHRFAKVLYRSLSTLKSLCLLFAWDPSSIKNKWYTAIKKTQINESKVLFLDRQNEIKDFVGVSTFHLLKYYLKNGLPNSDRFKRYYLRFFEGHTGAKQLKKAYDSVYFEYTLRLMLGYERYSMVADYLDFLVRDSARDLGEFKVLDYGCGVSDIGLLFASFGAEVTIADLDNRRFDFTVWRFKKRGYNPITIRIPDTEVYPELPEFKFDLIIATEIFEHVRDPLRLLKNLTRALKTDGYLFDSMGGHFDRDDRPHHLKEAFRIGRSREYREYYRSHYVQLALGERLNNLFKKIT